MRSRPPGLLVLADGTTFEGEAIGVTAVGGPPVQSGELVFNTAMSGYQEIISDPSYAGQVIAFTYPHIGNYGVTAADDESRRPFCRGIVVRDLPGRPSSWRATGDLESYLTAAGIGGLTAVDTRRLTRHVREAGAMPCAFGVAGRAELLAAAAAEPGTEGQDLVAGVTTATPYEVAGGPLRVVAYDFGIKRSILSQLARIASVEVVPAGTQPGEVLARWPDGAETYKLPFGHHGANHPVRRLATGTVEVTSQNHGYAVRADSIAGAAISHINLNDQVVEGLACRDIPAFSVQYHPEAGPGPHDARYLFAEFARLMEAHR